MRELANKSVDFTQVLPILVRESGRNPDAAVAYKELYREFAGFKNQILVWLQQSGCCNNSTIRGHNMTEQVLGRFVTTEASKGGTVVTRHITEVIRFTNDFIVVLMQPSGEQNINVADNDEWYVRIEGFQPATSYVLNWYVGGTPFTGATITTSAQGIAEVSGRIGDLIAAGLPVPADGGSMLSAQVGDYRSDPVPYVATAPVPAVGLTLSPATISVGAGTPFSLTVNGINGAVASFFEVNGVDDAGAANDILPATVASGQVIGGLASAFAAPPAPVQLVAVFATADGSVRSNPITLTP
jgi:hypothetical protein